MALTNAEKQRRYRERHLGKDGEKVRLQACISLACDNQLKRLAIHYGCSVTKMIEVLVRQAEKETLAALSATEAEAYLETDMPPER
jgi:hypothetical protein